MNLNVERHLHDQFKAATAADGKDMTTVLTDFIHEYVATAPSRISAPAG